MFERLGHVLSWIGTGIAAILMLLAVQSYSERRPGELRNDLLLGILALIIFGAGRALRYILSGRS